MIRIEQVSKTFRSRKISIHKRRPLEVKETETTPNSETTRKVRRFYTIKRKVTEALKQVSLDIETGEIFGLLGPNGAGKTTLMKIISTLIIPDTGSVQLNGTDVITNAKEARAKIGLVTSGERAVYWKLSPLENLRFFGQLYGLTKSQAETRGIELLEKVELLEKKDELVETLSTGMKMKLAFIRGLMHDPEILILDEMERGLDPEASVNLRTIITKELNQEQGKTILLATHNMQVADELSHRIALINNGEIIQLGTPRALKATTPYVRQLVFYTPETFDTQLLLSSKGVDAAIQEQEDESFKTTVNIAGNGAGLAVLNQATTHGLEISDFQLRTATLEDTFLHYTGRTLEGDGKA